MKRFLFFLIIGIPALSGCAPVLLMAAGAAGGYAVTRDSVTVDLDRPAERVWTAVVEETKQQGQIKKEDRPNHRLDAVVQKCDVV